TATMIVLWNGDPRETELLDSSTLRVTLTSKDLEKPSLAFLSVWDGATSSQVSDNASLLVHFPVWNNDLIFDPQRKRLYIAVSGKQVPEGRSIAVLDPETANIELYLPLESEPEALALSGDYRYLYVAPDHFVRRTDLNAWTPHLDIALGTNPLWGANHVRSMTALPGRNTSIAVSFGRPGVSPAYGGTAVFDGAQSR